jgi:uncharacterized protein involved in exopolysaccharide biosynthesis
MEQQQIDISSYMMVLKRRKKAFILPAGLVFCIAIAIAFLLPPSYKSEATILVEAQEIPEQMVQSTVTGYVEERIQGINQVVLSRANLLDIIDKNGLYQDMRRRSTVDEIVDKMREDISMTPLQAEVANPESGRTGLATIAFTLAYENRDPRKAQQIANILVSLFLEENAKRREEKAQTTVTFLEDQLAQLETTISSLEAKIAVFKEEHVLTLPELRDLNIQMLDRIEDRIDNVRQEIKNLENRQIYLEGQLALIDPLTNLPSGQQLDGLRHEYIAKRASLSDKHPDVITLKKSVEALESVLEIEDTIKKATEEYEAASLELVHLQERYSQQHPDVIKKRKAVQELIERLDKLSIQQKDLGVKEPDNPAYINILTQIKSTEFDIQASKKTLSELQTKQEEIQKRIEQTPKVEQEYKTLIRDYQNASVKHQETSSRLLKAREGKDLESNRIAQKLTLIDPPTLPEQPFKPNRLALLIFGLVLSVASGFGSGSLFEYLDNSVHTPQELAGLIPVPVLTAIPYLETIHDRQIKNRIRMQWIAGMSVFFLCSLAGIHFFFRPLDVIWIQIQQKLRFMF